MQEKVCGTGRRGSRKKNGEEIRLIACGGDGTLNEVINGAAGFGCFGGVMPWNGK